MCNCKNITVGCKFCPVCGAELKKEEKSKFNPKVGETYQTVDKRYKVRILATDLKGEYPLAVAYQSKDGNFEYTSALSLSGNFCNSPLILFKEPRQKTVYVHMLETFDQISTFTYQERQKDKQYIGRKKVTVVEGEFDE